MKKNGHIRIKNKGGRPVRIKHDLEIAKVCINLLERGFSLKDITWAIQAYYNDEDLSVKSIRALIKHLKRQRKTTKARQQGRRDTYSDWSKGRYNICRQF